MMGLEEIIEANKDPHKFYRSRLSDWEDNVGDRRRILLRSGRPKRQRRLKNSADSQVHEGLDKS